MLMSFVWLAMAAAAVLYGAATGTLNAVSAAVTEGAGSAVTLCLGIAGTVCLWSGVMEVMAQSGLQEALSRLLRPLLCRLFPESFAQDPDCAGAISLNFTANLLGLGNAATPAGLKAAAAMAQRAPGQLSGELCRLVVMNTASLQLIPATVAALRGSLGAAEPFDILPCVWITSLCSVSVGLLAERALAHIFP